MYECGDLTSRVCCSHRLIVYPIIFLLLIFMTGTVSAAYIATSDITYNSNTILSANVVNCINLTIDTNVVLTTNGYDIYCAGNVINHGTIITGSEGNGGSAGQVGTSVANSFGGSGGGAGASTLTAGEDGGSTSVSGGTGGTTTSENGNMGSSPALPTVSNANIITWSGNFIGYFSSAGGGGGLSGSAVTGGSGVYGLYIQASNIIAGSIIANGIAGDSGALLSSAGGGGGGGAFVLLSYGSGGYTAGTYNTLGGNGGAGAVGYGGGGSGGSGNVVAYDYGTIPPLDIITIPSISQSSSGNLDVGQSVTFSTSFIGGVSPYTYNWIVSNTVNGATVANSLYTSSLTSNTFTWTIAPSAAGNTVYANVIITDSLSSNSQGSQTTVNSIESSTIKVDAAPSVISITPSATTLDSGQSVTYSSEITGGTGPFTANLVTGGTTVNTITGISAGSVFDFGSVVPPTGTDTYNVIATDDGTSTPFVFNSISNTIKVDAAPSVISITPSATTLDSGQSVTYSSEITGGTPTFTANLIYVSGPSGATVDGLGTGRVIESLANQQDGTVSFPSFSSFSEAGSYTFNVVATDSASNPVTFNSLSNTITVNGIAAPPASSSGGGGPTKYMFVLSDNINSTSASANPVYVVDTDSGSVSYYQNQLPATLSLLTPYLNVSWACNVSVGTRTYAYQNDVYGIGFGIPCGKYYTTYVPNFESTYSLSAPAKITATTTITTTILPTTTISTVDKSITVNSTVSSALPASINFTNMHVIIVLMTSSPTPVHVSANLTNETQTILPAISNYTLISTLKVSVSATANVSTEITSPYPCSINSSLIKPFKLINGTWTAITPFSINTTSCTISFAAPKDPVVGIFQKMISTTIAPKTTMPITAVRPATTTVLPPLAPASNYTVSIVAIIVIIIIVAMAVYYYRRNGPRHKAPHH